MTLPFFGAAQFAGSDFLDTITGADAGVTSAQFRAKLA